MTLNKGWLSRQFARTSEDVQGWPSWMKREAGFNEPAAERPSSQDQRQAAPSPTSSKTNQATNS
jgi:hypothetical protein